MKRYQEKQNPEAEPFEVLQLKKRVAELEKQLKDAVIRDSKGATVRIKRGKNTFKNKMVEVGAEADGRIEIKNGLQTGDLVVITGAYLLNSEYIFKKGTNPMEGMKNVKKHK